MSVEPALVVGGSGFLGRALLRRLVSQGASVYQLTFADRPRQAATDEVAGARQLEAASSRSADIVAALRKVGTFDTVFHVAAAGVNPAHRNAGHLIEGNLLLPQAILEALAGTPPRVFVYAGSCAEYSPAPHGVLLTEDHPTAPADLYGASKAAGTIWTLALGRHLRVPVVALRLFHLFGPGEAAYRLVASLLRMLRKGEPVDLSPGEQVRDLLYIEDVLDGLLAAAGSRTIASGVYNLCSSQPVAVKAVAGVAARVLQKPESLLRFGALPYRDGELMWLGGDNRKFREASGWQPAWPLENALARMVAES